MSDFLLMPVGVETISSRVDGSVKITLGTQELPHDRAAKLFGYRRESAIMLLSKQDVTQDIIDEVVGSANDLPTTPIKRKITKSKRMRNVIYRIWETTDQSINFEDYYDQKMDQMTNSLIAKYLD